ncbi:hypothetical protein [Nonomuraea sp. NPDC003214]
MIEAVRMAIGTLRLWVSLWVAAALIGSCSIGSYSTSALRDPEDFRNLTESALWVAHPDYGLYPGPVLGDSGEGLTTSYSAYRLGDVMAGRSGALKITVSPAVDSTGVQISSFPRTRLGRALEVFGSAHTRADGKEEAREFLSNMGESVEVTVLVELVKPMAEGDVFDAKLGLPEPQRALLSYGEGELPLGNSIYCQRSCDEQSYVASFREWVSTLTPMDEPVLKSFGLSLKRLRAAAVAGKIYGMIYENYGAAPLLAILQHPMVKTVYVADVSLRCESDSAAICRPMRG